MKEFKDLTSDEVEKLKSTGLLWEIYPEANIDNVVTEVKFNYESYPDTKDVINPFLKPLFNLEFHTWNGKETTYKISRRCLLLTEKEFTDAIRDNDYPTLLSVEGHPYTLLSGVVNLNENAVDFETKSFLKFVVDALNSYTKTLDKV